MDEKISSTWKSVITAEWAQRRTTAANHDEDAANQRMQLVSDDGVGVEEILSMVDTLLSGRLTMGPRVDEFERKFAEWIGSPFAVMTNSGSSANLLAITSLVNHGRQQHQRLSHGDHVLIPAVCWPTSVWPIRQAGLIPVFVDVDPVTMNIDVIDVERRITSKTKAIVLVHVLGNSCPMIPLMKIVRKYNLIVVEDTCESLGSTAADDNSNNSSNNSSNSTTRFLGTFGDFGTYSFYYSHHMTTGEGGMVVCRSRDDYNLLRSLRSHGWSRHATPASTMPAAVAAAHPEIDSRFLFTHADAYNLRPMEIQAAMGIVQLRKLAISNECRRQNVERLRKAIMSDVRYQHQVTIFQAADGTNPVWFGVAFLLDGRYEHQYAELLVHLTTVGVENRPIVSGNFLRQPCMKHINGSKEGSMCEVGGSADPLSFPGAETVHRRGFFVGSHCVEMESLTIQFLCDAIFSFPFRSQCRVLVTGATGLVGSAVRKVMRGERGKEEEEDESSSFLSNCHFTFVGSADADLSNLTQCERLFSTVRPNMVLHLAAHLSGIHTMSQDHVGFYVKNSQINRNVLATAASFRGCTKVVSCLSTVMLPGNATYPISENAVHDGPPNPTASGYAMAKRELDMLSRWYSCGDSGGSGEGSNATTVTAEKNADDEKSATTTAAVAAVAAVATATTTTTTTTTTAATFQCVCVLPSNIFGPGGVFDVVNGPVVHAMIHKASIARDTKDVFYCYGTGAPLRQMLFSEDLARVLLWALECYEDVEEPVIVAGPEVSIKELAGVVARQVRFVGKIAWGGGVDGALRRTADTTKLRSMCGEKAGQQTSFEEAIAMTVQWFDQQQQQQQQGRVEGEDEEEEE